MNIILSPIAHLIALIVLAFGVLGVIGLARVGAGASKDPRLSWVPAALVFAVIELLSGHFFVAAGLALITSALCQIYLIHGDPDTDKTMLKPIVEIAIGVLYFVIIGGAASLIQYAIGLGVFVLIARAVFGLAGRALFGSAPQTSNLDVDDAGDGHLARAHAEAKGHAKKAWERHGHVVKRAHTRLFSVIAKHLIHGTGSGGGPGAGPGPDMRHL
jgi:hypothetical protein